MLPSFIEFVYGMHALGEIQIGAIAFLVQFLFGGKTLPDLENTGELVSNIISWEAKGFILIVNWLVVKLFSLQIDDYSKYKGI